MEQITKDIWTFPIELPQNPLKWLNCYVIKSETGRNLLIDTGFNRPECRKALLEGMEALELKPENTDVFLTHFHSDHTGNAAVLDQMGYRILMGSFDLSRMRTNTWPVMKARMCNEGMSVEMCERVMANNPAIIYAPTAFEAVPVEEGEHLCYGEHELECIVTPGHTPGHMCLYDRKNKIMFLGDHVLFDITPNITVAPVLVDTLGNYLESLKKIAGYDVELALPAHRNTGSLTMYERIDQILKHHEVRLAEAERVVREHPGVNAYDAAGMMTWRIQTRSWEEFPPGQKYFAVGETIAHMDYLINRGKIERLTDAEGRISYRCL